MVLEFLEFELRTAKLYNKMVLEFLEFEQHKAIGKRLTPY